MKKNSTAYIDASNLKFGVQQSSWELDYKAFRSWLRDKFGVSKAILFMGLIPSNFELYNYLQSIGYDIVFKPTITNKDGKTKGNVDGELILRIAKDFYENDLNSVVLVAGDGDYHCIVEFLKEKKVSTCIVSPNKKYLSFLLKRINVPIIILDDFIEKLKIKTKKPPNMP
ncbi:MAG: NYN domain-containing protein [Candidatus Pacebacteria bacterium]|nr:NYN domain-containing protein [Candidatus Paceibacterota bacterium]